MLSSTLIRVADERDVLACKGIADAHRAAIGFLPRGVFRESAARHRLLVADAGPRGIVGFIRFNHRVRGAETALYDICVAQESQGQGVGRALVVALERECLRAGRSSIVLRCPDGLPANDFYARLGFQRCELEPGRRRQLLKWRLLVRSGPCSS